jgi:hypothetical protein
MQTVFDSEQYPRPKKIAYDPDSTGVSIGPTVFLSHSYMEHDKGDIDGIKKFLRACKFTQEPIANLANEEELANFLKEKIETCDKFVAVITGGWLETFWCNWELNMAMRLKPLSDIAVVLVRPSENELISLNGNLCVTSNKDIALKNPEFPTIVYMGGNDLIDDNNVSMPTGYFLYDPDAEHYSVFNEDYCPCIAYVNGTEEQSADGSFVEAGYYFCNVVDQRFATLDSWLGIRDFALQTIFDQGQYPRLANPAHDPSLEAKPYSTLVYTDKNSDIAFEVENEGASVSEFSQLLTSGGMISPDFFKNEGKKYSDEELKEIGLPITPSVFLSHSHSENDNGDLYETKQLLKAHYMNIFVDSERSTEKLTNDAIASYLKGKIMACKKFVAIITDKWLQSYWCNWELNMAMRLKPLSDIAVVLVRPNENVSSISNWSVTSVNKDFTTIMYVDSSQNDTFRDDNNKPLPVGYYVCNLETRQSAVLEKVHCPCIAYATDVSATKDDANINGGYYVYNCIDKQFTDLVSWLGIKVELNFQGELSG